MKTLKETVVEARDRGVAVGHFNISDSEQCKGIFEAARELNLPVIIGTSEGERDFIGVKQSVALVKSFRDEFEYPIYLNADHTYSFERAKEAIDAGYDSVIVDGTKIGIEENLKMTRATVEYARASGREVVIEGEIGFIGTSSKLLDAIPEGVEITEDTITKPDDLKKYVEETGVDMVAPAVGNIHGMLKTGSDPRLFIERIKELRAVTDAPMVLHGGSGTVDEDFTNAIKAGIALIHINTEIRVAYRKGIEDFLKANPEEVAPYRFMKAGQDALKEVVLKRLRLFNHLA
jgi:fructose-bisphosphate aldolase class II